MNVIGVDWGSTHRRAYWLDENGRLLGKRSDTLGVLGRAEIDYPKSLEQLIGDWRRAGPARVWLSGMVGSRNGWCEVPYLATPARLSDLAAAARPAPGDAQVLLLPGLSQSQPTGPWDVMRGEETQLLGASQAGAAPRWCVLPGTHSKWVDVAEGRVRHFQTFMTGELYQLLRRNSSFAGLMQAAEPSSTEPIARAAFKQGLGMANSGNALAQVFQIRGQALLQGLPADAAAALLSGLLIGSEFASLRKQVQETSPALPLQLLASEALAAWYAYAADYFGLALQRLDADHCYSQALLALERAHHV